MQYFICNDSQEEELQLRACKTSNVLSLNQYHVFKLAITGIVISPSCSPTGLWLKCHNLLLKIF